MMLVFFVFSVSSVISVVSGQSRDATERETRASYRDQYGVLSDRNMFLRDRRRATTAPASTQAAAEKAPEQTFMLTGVVYEPLEETAFAYFEDLNANTILRVRVGEKVARGTIAGIDINAVSYERDGKHTNVLVGEDLTGAKASIGGSSADVGTASLGATSAPAIDPNNPNLTTEQRMRLRRQQERR